MTTDRRRVWEIGNDLRGIWPCHAPAALPLAWGLFACTTPSAVPRLCSVM